MLRDISDTFAYSYSFLYQGTIRSFENLLETIIRQKNIILDKKYIICSFLLPVLYFIVILIKSSTSCGVNFFFLMVQYFTTVVD